MFAVCFMCVLLKKLLEPSFNSKMPEIGKALVILVKMVFDAFPVDSAATPQDVKLLHQKVEELIHKQLAAVTAAQPSGMDARVAYTMISLSISVLQSLTEGNKTYLDRFMMPLVRTVQRLSRDMSTTTTALARQVVWYPALWLLGAVFKYRC